MVSGYGDRGTVAQRRGFGGCAGHQAPLFSAAAFSSPTRISKPLWLGLLGASRRTRTAVTQRQLTRPAATRDASSRHPHIATKAHTPPQTKREFCPGETETPGKENIPREERTRGREFESYFHLKIPVGPTGICTPTPTHLPCLWALPRGYGRLWLPFLTPTAAFCLACPRLCLSSHQPSAVLGWVGGCPWQWQGLGVGLKKPSPLSFPILLFMRPSSSQLPLWGLPTSLMIPHLSVHFTLGTPVSSTCPLPLLCCPLSPPVLA